MDASLTSRLLTELLPPDLADTVRQHLLNPRAPLQIYRQKAFTYAQSAVSAANPYVQPLADRFLSLVVDNQGVTGVVVLLAAVTAVVIVMNWLRRLVMWWTRLVMRMMFWAVVVVLVSWVWNRGVMESARDGVVLVSKVAGYLSVLKDVWLEEYDRYEGQQHGRAYVKNPVGRSAKGRSSGR